MTSYSSLAVWSVKRKKPLCTMQAAHGLDASGLPRWVSSVGAWRVGHFDRRWRLTWLQYGDVFASGSYDGKLRLWQLINDNMKMAPMAELSLVR